MPVPVVKVITPSTLLPAMLIVAPVPTTVDDPRVILEAFRHPAYPQA